MHRKLSHPRRSFFYLPIFVLLFSLWHNDIQAQCSTGINETFAIVNSGSGNVYYNLQSSSSNPSFIDHNFGSYCSSGTLILNGGQNKVYKCHGGDIWQNRIWYRIYLTTATPGSFNPLTEYYSSGTSNGCGGQDQVWEVNNANVNVLAGLSAGTYYLEVYSTADYQYCGTGTWYASNSGYNYRATFTVNATPSPTVNSPTICAGHTATLVATGGTSYVWSTRETTSSISTSTGGTYTVTATNSSSCTASASGTVTVNANPTPTVNSPTICVGATATLTATGGVSYVWNTTATTTSITTSTPGVYTVTATNASGCTASVNGTVTVNSNPTPTVNSPTICAGATATLTATGGVSYVWSTTATTTSITTSTGGTYTVTATNSYGCTASASGIVTVNSTPTPTVNKDTVCSGVTAILTATGGVHYAWNRGDTTASITTTVSGSYPVTVTNSNGCTASASGTVVVNSNPTASVNNASICAGGTATLTATGGTTYLWNTDLNIATLTTVTAGTYTVTVTNAAGCTASANGTVTVHANPTPHAGLDTTVNVATSVLLGDTLSIGGTAPYVFKWTPNVGLNDTTLRRPLATPVVNTNYIVQATDSFGCSGRDTVTVYFDTVNVLTVITYSGQNIHYSTVGTQNFVEFDVFATDSPAGLLYSQSEIFVQYDSTIFGTHLVDSNKIVATKGLAVDSPYYNLSLSDSTPTMLKIAITHTPNPASLRNLGNVNQQLCHLKINLTGLNLTTVAAAFDTIAMAGRSKYQRSVAGLEFPYNIIRISGLTAASQVDEDSINFSIVGVSLDNLSSPSYVDFDVLATANIYGANLGRCSVTLNFDSHAFDSAYVTNIIGVGDDASFSASGSGCCGGNEIYSFSKTFNPGSLNITLDADSNYDTSPSSLQTYDQIYSPTTLYHVRLHIANCHYFPHITIDPTSYAQWNDTNNIYSFTSYTPVHIGPGYNDSMCTPLPIVTGFSPTCTNAGSFEVMTIAGHYFGQYQGKVYFNNANNPGTFIHAHDDDIRNWTRDTITLLIPSAVTTDPTVGTAGSGTFYVKTFDGLDNSADSVQITLGHANFNRRSPDNLAHFVYLRDSTYIFHLSSNLFLTSGVMESVQSIFSDLRCQTGINFWVDSTGISPVDTANGTDHINVISMQSDTSHIWDHVALSALAITSPNSHSCSNPLPEYNNSASYATDIDITFKNPPPSPYGGGGIGGWNWWLYVTSPTTGVYDAPSVLTHELGHGALLSHALPEKSGSHNVMHPSIAPQQLRRYYHDDFNSILGVKYCLSLGSTLGTSGGCPAATPVFPSGCPTVNPTTCVDNTNGIQEVVHSIAGFSAYLYPNPYQDNTIVHVDVSEYGNYSVTVYDVIGQLITFKSISTNTSFDVPLSGFNFSVGMYLIQVSDSHNNVVLKLIKL